MAFFDPDAIVVIRHGKLPHWRQEGVIYFVTFRLADSLPQAKLEWLRREKELWLRLNSEPRTDSQQREYHERFTQTVDRWLDAGCGRCILARPDCKAIMEASLMHFDGVRYELGEFVVMPNHVHAIVAPIGGYQLSHILHSWNRSRRIGLKAFFLGPDTSGVTKASITSSAARNISLILRNTSGTILSAVIEHSALPSLYAKRYRLWPFERKAGRFNYSRE